MSIEKENIHWIDALELAAHITETTELFENEQFDEVEEKVVEMFDCDMHGFTEIVARLLPMAMVASSPLSDTKMQGFADTENNCFVLKREI